MALERAKRGRKPKGVREQIGVRVPVEQKALYEEAARAAGLPLGDYVAIILAQHHDLDLPSYLLENKNQEQLPISA